MNNQTNNQQHTTQTEHLTYSQAMECLLDGDGTYIACTDSHIADALIILDTCDELRDIGCFNEVEYASYNWFIG